MKWLIPIGLALVVAAQSPVSSYAQTARSGVRDRAHLFSDQAIKKATAALDAVRRERGVQVMIETVESLHGASVRDRAVANAEALKLHGLYILISRDDHKVWATPSQSTQALYSHEKIQAIIQAITGAFKQKNYDRGLLDAVALIETDAGVPRGERSGPAAARTIEPAPPPPSARANVPAVPADRPRVPGDPPRVPVAAAQPSRLPMFIGIGVGAVILLWLFSRARGSSQSSAQAGQPAYAPAPPGAPTAYGPGQPVPPGGAYAGPPRGPGYGPGPGYAPGYGPPPQGAGGGGGGGGFMSGMLGGLGGAVVGNILYDKFGRPHPAPESGPVHGGVVPPTGYPHDPGSVQPPAESYDPNAGAGGDWGNDAAPPPAQPDQWSAAEGAGGDWGTPEPQGAAENWDQGAGAGGDWGSEPAADDPGAGGDWGQDSGGSPDEGTGGDWGQDASTDEGNGGGGDW